jgi:hypothetical protein
MNLGVEDMHAIRRNGARFGLLSARPGRDLLGADRRARLQEVKAWRISGDQPYWICARLSEAVVDRYLKCRQVYGHVKYVSHVVFIVTPSIMSGYLSVIED